MDDNLQQLFDGILTGQAPQVSATVEQALAAGVAPSAVLDRMIDAMGEVGRRFECGEYFPPEMLISARAMQAGLTLLKPHLRAAAARSAGTVVIGTVRGDLHDIGKNLVGIMLEGAGFQIQDLGTNVPPEKFVAAVQAGGVDLVALSALLTTTMPNMKATIDALRSAGVRDKVKVIVGGAPLTDAYAEQIGADGFSPDASRAVKVAKSLLGV